MRLVVSEQAGRDLQHIYSYLAERNPSVAETIIKQIDQKFQNLSHFPFIGRERSSLAPGVRSIVAGMYVIFYLVERDSIAIVRVLDGRRDIDAEFQR
jgi:toxin ParE1/3/4